ncbi:MAG: Cna B-type domain-containing protein, partial [Anaerolactibacter massiliensis]|nr:Cna B-type domain-containing protein [Anaerolactibacter massiliensis]
MKKRNKLRTLALVLALLSGGIQPTVFAEEYTGNSDQPATETAASETEQNSTENPAVSSDENTDVSSDFSSSDSDPGEQNSSVQTSAEPEQSEDNTSENKAEDGAGERVTGTGTDPELEEGTDTEETDAAVYSYSVAPAVNLLSGNDDSTSWIQIDYDSDTAIHSVTDASGNKIILFCMNNQLHWPHETPDSPNVALYEEVSFEDFFSRNNNTVIDPSSLKTALENILYAGYPYNGYGLYQVVDQTVTLDEDSFNALLVPPQYLREDFPDSIGNNTFTYADRNDSTKMGLLNSFLLEVSALFRGGTTKSGLTHQQITVLPFWRAAYLMINSPDDPINDYSTLYSAGYFVTETQAYEGTQNAIWTLLKRAGLENNDLDKDDGLSGNLLAADTANLILTEAPSSDSLSVAGNFPFYYDPADEKWHTESLSISAPGNYHAVFTLNLPSGVTEESGKTQVKSGESFSLASSTKPSGELTISATIQWMDPELKVYAADSTKASDGKTFQNMIGAVIHKTVISKSVELSAAETNFTFTKVWDDSNNEYKNRPSTEKFSSSLTLKADGVVMTGYEPEITENEDGTWTVTYQNLPGLKDKSYSVSENSITGYISETSSVSDGGRLTNKLETITVAGEKTWEDNNNENNKRPDSITVNLLADGKLIKSAEVKAAADGTWTYSFENLPKYEAGRKIVYTVSEEKVADYSTAVNGYD